MTTDSTDGGREAIRALLVQQIGHDRTTTRSMHDSADAILAALASNGLVIVPADPTEEMEIAGQIDPTPVSSGDIYRAMIAKANPPYSGDGPFDVGPRYSWPGETK